MQLDANRGFQSPAHQALRRASAGFIMLAALALAACSEEAARPDAVISGPGTAELGGVVQLDASGSENPGGGSLAYRWRFVTLPDASRAAFNDSTIVNPSFVADAPGDYQIGLVVDNGFQISSEVTHTVSVAECGGRPPAVDAISADPGTPGVGDTVRFSAVVADEDNAEGCGRNQSFSYAWRLVGLPTASQATLNDPSLPSPWLVADASGTYTVELVVTDSEGLESGLESFSVNVTVCGEARPSIDSLSADPLSAGVGETVVLSAVITDADNEGDCEAGQTFSYAWSLASAPAASDAQVARAELEDAWLVPDVAGEYVVALVVTDSTGRISDPGELTVTVSDAEVVATVVAEPTSGLAPLTVDFTCNATGDEPIRYAWSFGNGAVSNLQSPSFTYTGAGLFTATCLAVDVDGDSSTATADITVNADTTPTIEASADPVVGVAPLDVAFSALATGGEGELTYAWDFADGKTSDQVAPTNTFADPGLYAVVVTVTDEDGDSASDLIEIAVGSDNQPAVAVAATPETGIAPLLVQFQAFTAGGNAPLTYSWSFGDGDDSTLQNPQHTYVTAVDQSYTAEVTVTDVDGDTATAEVIVFVEGDAVVTNANATATPATGRVPLLVGFGCDADGGNEPLAYAWTFGDGATSSLQNPTHIYRDADSYTATCVVTDADGDTDSDTVAVTAQLNRIPTVALSADVTSGVEPLEVVFTATTSGGDAPLVLDWDFGDGTVESGGSASETRTYDAGVYQVGVVVEDVDGDTDRATLVISVDAEGAPIEVVAAANPTAGIADEGVPLQVAFTAQVAGGNPPYTYVWNFDGGATNSTLANPTVALAARPADPYDVTVVVTDADGDAAAPAGVQVVVAADAEPVLGTLTATDTDALDLAPLLVSFTCPLATPGNGLHTFAWSFGDGQSSTLQNPSHTYAAAGNYTATCTVTDADGDVASATVSRTAVLDTAPVPTILGGPLTGLHPHTADFNSSVVGGNGTLQYQWSFGNGTVIAFPGVADPGAQTYNTPGTYSVVLRVRDEDGDEREATTTVVVGSDETPTAAVAADVTAGVAPLTVNFTATVAGGNGTSTLSWDLDDDGVFGDSIAANPTWTYGVGSFDVTVRATDADGDSDEATITIGPVVADDDIVSVTADFDVLGGNTLLLPPLSADFSCVVVGGNAPYTYAWNFGDGATSTQQDPIHDYAAAGTYNAVCTVTDADGDQESGTTSVTVNADTAPVVALTATPTSGTVGPGDPPQGLTVVFTSAVSQGNGTLVYEWNFGGSGTLMTAPADGATETFVYDSPGTFVATLTVRDEGGVAPFSESGSDSETISVRGYVAPTVVASAVPASGVSPLTVNFFANAAGSELPRTFAWDFDGDDVTDSTEQNPTFVYETGVDASFTAEVTVTDGIGEEASDTVVVNVARDADPEITVFTITPEADRAPVTADLSCTWTAGNGPTRLQWIFGDGQTATINNVPPPDPAGPQTQTVSHTYAVVGLYEAQCIVTDANNDTDSATDTIDVQFNTVPSVSLAASPSSGVEDLTVAFTASRTGGEGTILWTWSFGGAGTDDGSPNSALESFTYVNPGTFIATVTACDEDEECDSASQTIQVAADLTPAVAATASPASGPSPLAVQLSANATGGNGPLSVSWVFSDGTTAVGPNPTHTFTYVADNDPDPLADRHLFTATVTVTDADGDVAPDGDPNPAVDTRVVQIAVGAPNRAPEAHAIADVQCVAAPTTILLDAACPIWAPPGCIPSSDVDGNVLSYNWQFTGLPFGSDAEISNPTLRNPTFITDVDGDYVVQLEVSDGSLIDRTELTVRRSRVPATITAIGGPTRQGAMGTTITPPLEVEVLNSCGTLGSVPIPDLEVEWDGGDVGIPSFNFSFTDSDGRTIYDDFEGAASFATFSGPVPRVGQVVATIFDEVPGPDPTVTFTLTVDANCEDDELNGDETDFDCGGACAGLGLLCGCGDGCAVDTDCVSGFGCDGGTCRIPGVWLVDGAVSGEVDQDGLCWDTAFDNLQPGINAALGGGQLWVAAYPEGTGQGVYTPDNGLEGGFDIQGDGIAILGGFTGVETTESQRNPDPETNGTILEGFGNLSLHVINVTDSQDVVIDGLTIQGGRAWGFFQERDRSGGGLFVLDSSDVTVANVVFQNNEATDWGGGMNVSASQNVFVEDSIFRFNRTGWGGGGLSIGHDVANNPSSNVVVTRTRFENNQQHYSLAPPGDARGGGAINLDQLCGVTIDNSLFTENTASINSGSPFFNSGGGGAIYAGDASGAPGCTTGALIAHSTFWHNEALESGALGDVLYTRFSADVEVANSLMADCPSVEATFLTSCIFETGTPVTVTDSEIGDGALCNDFDTPPSAAFFSPPFDLHLVEGTTCEGLGNDSVCAAFPSDFEGVSRSPVACNLGALETLVPPPPPIP